jgi:hypothetical protein
MHVYCSTIHNKQAIETALMLNNWLMDFKNVIYTYMYVCVMQNYSFIKKNEVMLFAGKWMELEDIMLSEVSQVQKSKGHIFSLICGR